MNGLKTKKEIDIEAINTALGLIERASKCLKNVDCGEVQGILDHAYEDLTNEAIALDVGENTVAFFKSSGLVLKGVK